MIFFLIFMILTLCFSFCSEVLVEFFDHIGNTDPNFLFSLRKAVPAFTGTNEKRQARLTGNYSGSQSFFSEMVSKRVRKIYTKETISGFVRSGLPWSILVCTRIMLDTMHQYGLRSSLHQSCSRK